MIADIMEVRRGISERCLYVCTDKREEAQDMYTHRSMGDTTY